MEVSSLSFYHFDNKRSQWWAFKQMRLAYAELAKTEGLIFHKQLCSGAGACFSIWPNWGVYAQLMVLKSQDFFAEYLAKNPYHQAFLRESKKHIHIRWRYNRHITQTGSYSWFMSYCNIMCT